MDFIDVNLSDYTAECPDRTHVYLLLVVKAVSDFTEQDRADWLYATGQKMPAPKPFIRREYTMKQLWGVGTAEL